jgi:hypothetical protein
LSRRPILDCRATADRVAPRCGGLDDLAIDGDRPRVAQRLTFSVRLRGVMPGKMSRDHVAGRRGSVHHAPPLSMMACRCSHISRCLMACGVICGGCPFALLGIVIVRGAGRGASGVSLMLGLPLSGVGTRRGCGRGLCILAPSAPAPKDPASIACRWRKLGACRAIARLRAAIWLRDRVRCCRSQSRRCHSSADLRRSFAPWRPRGFSCEKTIWRPARARLLARRRSPVARRADPGSSDSLPSRRHRSVG